MLKILISFGQMPSGVWLDQGYVTGSFHQFCVRLGLKGFGSGEDLETWVLGPELALGALAVGLIRGARRNGCLAPINPRPGANSTGRTPKRRASYIQRPPVGGFPKNRVGQMFPRPQTGREVFPTKRRTWIRGASAICRKDPRG